MKNLLAAFIIMLALFTSCKKASTENVTQETKPADTTAVLQMQDHL